MYQIDEISVQFNYDCDSTSNLNTTETTSFRISASESDTFKVLM
jgi:hypothetical protein